MIAITLTTFLFCIHNGTSSIKGSISIRPNLMKLTVSKKFFYFSCANMGTVSKFSLQTKEVFIAYVIRNIYVAYSGDNPLL